MNIKRNEAKIKAAVARKAALKRTTGRATDRRSIGEYRKLSDAVKSFCSECHGFDVEGGGSMHAIVESCTVTECHLYLWRNGKLHLEEAEEEQA